MRKIYMDFKELSLVGDVNKGTVKEYERSKVRNIYEYKIGPNSTYINQLNYFFDHIDDCSMMNNLQEAAILFKKIINFKTRKNRCQTS